MLAEKTPLLNAGLVATILAAVGVISLFGILIALTPITGFKSVFDACHIFTPEQLTVSSGISQIDASGALRLMSGKEQPVKLNLPIPRLYLEDYPLVDVEVSTERSLQLRITWISDRSMAGAKQELPLEINYDSPITRLNHSGNPLWSGLTSTLSIESSGLGSALAIREIAICPLSVIGRAQRVLRDAKSKSWFGVKHMNYVQQLVGEAGQSRTGILFVFVVVVVGAILQLVRDPLARARGLVFTLVAVWTISDLIWMRTVWSNSMYSFYRFSGKSLDERRMASDDAALWRFSLRLKTELPLDQDVVTVEPYGPNSELLSKLGYQIAPRSVTWGGYYPAKPGNLFVTHVSDIEIFDAPSQTVVLRGQYKFKAKWRFTESGLAAFERQM